MPDCAGWFVFALGSTLIACPDIVVMGTMVAVVVCGAAVEVGTVNGVNAGVGSCVTCTVSGVDAGPAETGAVGWFEVGSTENCCVGWFGMGMAEGCAVGWLVVMGVAGPVCPCDPTDGVTAGGSVTAGEVDPAVAGWVGFVPGTDDLPVVSVALEAGSGVVVDLPLPDRVCLPEADCWSVPLACL